MTRTDLVLRPATPDDVAEIADLHLAARQAAPMPASVHSDDAVRTWLGARLGTDETWVAEAEGEVVGYARFTDTWLDDLYVAPAWQGRGVGSALLDLIKSLRTDGFGLWVFVSNLPARAFYAGHGLVEVEHTDGAANEEGEPDVAMRWDPEMSAGPGNLGRVGRLS